MVNAVVCYSSEGKWTLTILAQCAFEALWTLTYLIPILCTSPSIETGISTTHP